MPTPSLATARETEPPKLDAVETPTATVPNEPLAAVPPPARVAGIGQDAATTLRVRIVDAAGIVQTRGRIECWWSAAHDGTEHPIRTRVIADVVSESTEVRLPGAASEALVRGWLADQRRTREVTVRDLVHADRGPLERDIVLAVEPPPDPSIFRGIVTVDGRRFVPRGLTIERRQTNRKIDAARIDGANATFELDDVIAGAELWATSEETVPVKVVVSPEAAGSGTLDLELSDARMLRLTFLHKVTGKPLANLGFVVAKGVHLEGPVSRSDARAYHTDAQGRCDVRGLAAGMFVTIHPDLSVSGDPASIAQGTGARVDLRAARWWTERVTAEPAIIEVELRVVPVFPGASVFGALAPALVAKQAAADERVRVMAREITDAQSSQASPVSVDPRGSWSFQAHWPSRFDVWLERAGNSARVSKRIVVDVDSAGPHGPIDLAVEPAELGTEFELRLIHVPSGAALSMWWQEEGEATRHEGIECKGSSCTHRVLLRGPRELRVTARLNQDNFGSEVRRSLMVDPTREPTGTIDMGGDQMRAIEFSVSGATLPAYALVGFVRLGPQGTILTEATSTTLLDGRATADVSLSAGRWFFECFDAQRNFNVTGVVDVTAGSDTLRIARDTVAVDSSKFPRGIDFTELDGVALGNLERPIRYTELGPSGKVILNASARYRPLP
jgi:hypothetical protein